MLLEPHKNSGNEAGQSYQVHVHTRKQAQGMARPNLDFSAESSATSKRLAL